MITPPIKSGTKLLIGYPTLEFSRQAMFYDHINALSKPEGTIVTTTHGQSPARGRNMIIQEALRNECTHVMFFDDDLAFAPNTMMNLLAHDVDMVTGLYLMRNHPHQPIIFDIAQHDGKCTHHYLDDNAKGLVEIVAAGLGACLIKTEVFVKMRDEDTHYKSMVPYPWVRLGELEIDHWCDDIGFFRRATRAGFKLFCDLETPIGHMGTCTFWPNRINGVWHTAYDTAGREVINAPQIKNYREAALKSAGKPIWSEPFSKKKTILDEKEKSTLNLVPEMPSDTLVEVE